MNKTDLPAGVELRGTLTLQLSEILSPEALKFFVQLQREVAVYRATKSRPNAGHLLDTTGST